MRNVKEVQFLKFLLRYRKANEKYLTSYDPQQESKHIIDLDANDLYGYAMYKFLPTSRFKCEDPEVFDLNKYTSNNSKGFVLEVDLEYSKELCQFHNDYPLAPDKIEIKREKLSKYQQLIADYPNIYPNIYPNDYSTISQLAMLKNYCLTFLIKKSM